MKMADENNKIVYKDCVFGNRLYRGNNFLVNYHWVSYEEQYKT